VGLDAPVTATRELVRWLANALVIHFLAPQIPAGNLQLRSIFGIIHASAELCNCENGSFYFPITTSILVSVVLTIVLNVIARWLRK